MSYYTKHIMLCTNKKEGGKTCCANTGGDEFFTYMKNKLSTLGVHGPGAMRVSKSGCLGRCNSGPCLVIYPEGVWYSYSSFADIDRIVDDHLLADSRVDELLIEE